MEILQALEFVGIYYKVKGRRFVEMKTLEHCFKNPRWSIQLNVLISLRNSRFWYYDISGCYR